MCLYPCFYLDYLQFLDTMLKGVQSFYDSWNVSRRRCFAWINRATLSNRAAGTDGRDICPPGPYFERSVDPILTESTMEDLLLFNTNTFFQGDHIRLRIWVSSTSRHSLMHIFLEKPSCLLQFVSVNPLEQILINWLDISGWNLVLA